MKGKERHTVLIAAGFVIALVLSNVHSFVSDGRRLDGLRDGVLRLHILADSDSDKAQRLKMCVRDSVGQSA